MTESATKQVQIQYFAVLRDESGLSAETTDTSASTLRELYESLKTRHGFKSDCEKLRVALNDRFASWDDILPDNARVIFIPPVAGG